MKTHGQMARFGFAFKGMGTTWQQERSFRTEVIAIALVFSWMAWMHVPIFWWLAMGGAATLILVAELINTAIENICDAVHPEKHPLIGAAKDCGSAAVLLSCIFSVVLFTCLVVSLWIR